MVGGGTGKEEMLVMGCCRGDFVGAAALLDSGADPNCSDTSTGWTPLHFASKNNHIALVSLLLSRGADPSARNILGQTAREMTSSLEIATLLRISDSPPTSPDTHSLADRSYEAPQDRRLSQSEDIVIKIRIANSPDPDFIEIELTNGNLTYQNLISTCCKELEISRDQVNRVRKLPDTRIRSDADVRRLKPFQELEVVLKESTLSLHLPSNNIYPSISSNKNQTVLY